MQIKAVIFDLDGTLLDSIEDIADANNAMLREHNYPEHPLSNYVKWIGNGAMQLVIESLPKGANMDEDMLHAYLMEYKELYNTNISNKSELYNCCQIG